jgi:hypothetical protein
MDDATTPDRLTVPRDYVAGQMGTREAIEPAGSTTMPISSSPNT